MKIRPLSKLLLGLSIVSVALAVWIFLRPDKAHIASTTAEKTVTRSDTPQYTTSIDPDAPALAERRESLLRMDREDARAWILDELDRGVDFQTQRDLEIGNDQNLTGWPSYRVYLLDMLFLVDPDVAARKSRELVEISESPDEWAVALRNVARADADGRQNEWLRAKSASLLRNQTWRADPTAGYLNAFDVIVHARHTELAPELLELSDDRDRKAARHASFLTLDRLVQDSPGVLLRLLAQSADRFPQSGLMISNLMARGDVRDAAQRDALETYLLAENRTEEELVGFASVFPNANFHISDNLLTRAQGIDGTDLAERDRAALATTSEWLADARFSHVHAALRVAQARLKRFVDAEP